MKKSKAPKIAILVCSNKRNSFDYNFVKNYCFELSLLAEIKLEKFILKADQQLNWLELADKIKKSKMDGFVIVAENNDDLLYLSAAVSYMLAACNKTVVITSLYQDEKFSFASKANILNSVQLAGKNLSVAGIMHGNQLVRATRAVANDFQSLNIYNSLDNKNLAEIKFGVELKDLKIYKSSIRLKSKTADKVLFLDEHSGLRPAELVELSRQFDGLIYQAKNPDEEFLAELSKPVVAFSARKLKRVISLNNMTKPALIVKFMIALGQNWSFPKLKKFMLTDIAGELK